MTFVNRLRKAWLGFCLRDDRQQPAASSEASTNPAVVRSAASHYDPEGAVYGSTEVNPIRVAEHSFRGFERAVRENRAQLKVSAIGYDGQREIIDLSPAQARAYLEGATADDRRTYRFARIREQRAAIAKNAAQKLREGAALKSLAPREEAALREFDAFDADDRLREDWSTPWNNGQATSVPYTDQEWLPYGQGPLGTQLYLADMWEMLAKAWWAWTHDPLAKQGVNIIATFVLAGGLEIHCEDEDTQKVVDEFWEREKMDLRTRTWLTDLGRDGELFGRIIPDGTGKCRARSLDPTTIWEIITDAEDIEHVYAYAQRYMTRTQLLTIDGVESQTYIERELAPDEVVHVKLNATSSDVRGRSDLFVILGYLKRLRDYFDAEVIKAQAAAAYHRDVAIDGSGDDVQAFAAAEALKGEPQPGETWYHNKAVEINMVQGGNRAPAANGSVYAGLVNLIGIGLGISKEYLGVTEHASLASAEVSTDPAFQTFEVRQQLYRDFLARIIDRIIDEAAKFSLLPPDASRSFKIVFGGIRQDDKGKKIERLAIGEGMGWWSKETAAVAAAPEADLDDYNFEEEQDRIATEHNAVILATYAQVPKGYAQLTQPAFAPGSVVNPDAAPPAPSTPPKTPEARERGIVIIP